MPEKRRHRGCGKSCIRCWTNNLIHNNPKSDKYVIKHFENKNKKKFKPIWEKEYPEGIRFMNSEPPKDYIMPKLKEDEKRDRKYKINKKKWNREREMRKERLEEEEINKKNMEI